jgi:c(7)-type cytochrome triheme protein
MKYIIFMTTLVAAASFWGAAAADENKKPPEKLVFRIPATVVFDHAGHVKREEGNCSRCHDKIWQQVFKEPLRSPVNGCKTCHKTGKGAFDYQGNCDKCHPEGVQREKRTFK